MKTFIKELFFDKKLVNTIKESNPDRNFLYQQLIAGKITLKEYLAAVAGKTSN